MWTYIYIICSLSDSLTIFHYIAYVCHLYHNTFLNFKKREKIGQSEDQENRDHLVWVPPDEVYDPSQ